MSDVPSNLIPTRITELPEYDGTDATGFSPYAINGRTYKATLANIVAPLADDVAIAAAAAEAAKLAAQTYKFDASASALAAANSAADALSASQAAAGSANYFPTIAEGVAGTEVGQAFSSAEGGVLRLYEHIAGAPGHNVIGELDATLRTELAAPTGAELVGAAGGGTLGDAAFWVTPEQFGAVGDGVTDDRAALQAAVDYASANGLGVRGRAGAEYRCAPMPTSVHNFGIGPQPNLVIPAAAPPIDFQGATLKMNNGGRGFFHSVVNWPQNYAIGTVTADIAAGAFDFPLQTGEGALFQAGDRVLWQLGEIPYDKPETTNWGHAKVLSVTGDTVKLDRPLYEPFAIASVTTGRKRLIRLDRNWRKPVLRNVHIDGTISSTVGAENGVAFYGAPTFECHNVSGTFCGAGVIVQQYVEQADISFCDADKVNVTQASYGKHINLAEARSVNMRGGVARAMKFGIAAEADGDISVNGYHFDNTYPGNGTTPAVNTAIVFGATGRARIVATDTLVTGLGGFNLANISNGQAGWEGSVQVRNLRVRTSGEAYNLPLDMMSGVLDYTVAGVRQRFNLDRPKVWHRKFRLKDGMSAATFVGPPGLVIAARAYTSPDLTVGTGNKLLEFYVGKAAGGAANGNDFATYGLSGVKLVPGQWVELPVFGGTVAGSQWTYRTNNQQVIITTGAAAGINATDDFVTLETLYVPEEGSKTYAYAEAYYRAEGDEYELYEALISAVDLPSIAAGATQTQALTIPDMANTDLFVGYSIAGGYGGLTLTKVECQTGQAMLTFKNETGSPIDLSARDMRVLFAKPQAGA